MVRNEYLWEGLPVLSPLNELNASYLSNVRALLLGCLDRHPRWTVIRVDLRCPARCFIVDRAVTKFFESLKAQLNHSAVQKAAQNKRAHPHMLHYIWVREQSMADQPHYHLAIVINRDAYFGLGDYSYLYHPEASYTQSLAGRICKAWGVALGLDWKVAIDGVHFPRNAVYQLMRDSTRYNEQFHAVFYRLSYLAKYATKYTADGGRGFGMSQI